MNESERSGTRNRAPPGPTVAASDHRPPTLDDAARAAVAAAIAADGACLIHGGTPETRAAIAAEIAGRMPGQLLVLAPDPDAWRARIIRRCPDCARAAPVRSSWLSRLLRGLGLSRGCPPTCAHVPTTVAHAAAPPTGSVDSLLVVEAQALGESPLTAAAARARRAVFVGAAGPSHFGDWVRRLSFDPWVREEERIVCRLRPVPDRRRLAVEAVADQPDIELRILADADGSSDLAEVAFPGRVGIAEAKSYIRQQLGGAPPCLAPHGGHWQATSEAIEARFVESPHKPSIEAVPDDGVIESIAETGAGWSLAGLRFDRAAGWTEESAADWFRRAAERHGQGRIIHLPHDPPMPPMTPLRNASQISC
jgi:hypothetical protein